MSSRWGDWDGYHRGRTPPPPGGLTSSKRRGSMAATWWSKRFTNVLESYGLEGRMGRGRTYARKGHVLDMTVQPGVITSRVAGTSTYKVTITFKPPTDSQWSKLGEAFNQKLGFAARLLDGEMPSDLEDLFETVGTTLFPKTWRNIQARCSCPDFGNPCKHIAAVLYVFADKLDEDPWLLLQWRGRSRDEILSAVRTSTDDSQTPAIVSEDEIAPWWPFAPNLPPSVTDVPPLFGMSAVDPENPDAVLARLEEFETPQNQRSFRAILRTIYEALVTPVEDANSLTD